MRMLMALSLGVLMGAGTSIGKPTYKCMNTKGIQIKSAKKASQCTIPNHWVEVPQTKGQKPIAKKDQAPRPRKGH